MKGSRVEGALWRWREAMSRQFGREALSDLFHVLALFALVIVLRPLFMAPIAGVHYEAPTVLTSILEQDIATLKAAAQRQRAAPPDLLFLLIPTFFLAFRRPAMRWTDWEHGRSLRVLVLAVLAVVVYAGATFDYNVLLNRGHPWDRLLLVVLAALCWRTPLAVPFATRWAFIMIREPYHPIIQDDFEYRSVTELLTVFSIFVWASAKRTFKPWHFLLVGVGSWAAYYFVAGVAKWNYGPPHSWLLENHLTNLAISAHVRGWLGFVSDDVFVGIMAALRPYDRVLAVFTMVVELGAVAALFLHPKLTRFWFFLLLVLQLGIFVMTGICFWKWMAVNAIFVVWTGRGGAAIVEKMCRYKLVAVLGIASIYYADQKVWYWPQKGVAWYDTPLIDQYDIYAVGVSGRKYLVDPNYFAPSDMHFVQGRLCYATEKERGITSIYGVTGSYSIMKQLNELTDPQQALALHRKGRVCANPKQKPMFDDFMRRFFSNINRYGRPYDWLSNLGRPHHLQVSAQGDLFDEQERVVKVELWRRTVYERDGKYHELENKLGATVDIPQ